MMNFKTFKFDAAAGIWLKLAGNAAAITVGLILYYHFTVANYSGKFNDISSSIIAVGVKHTQYENYGMFKNTLEQSGENIDGLLPGYMNMVTAAQKSQNIFLDQISAMAVQSKIKLDKIAPIELSGKKYWDISFTSDYRSICEYFTLLEKYFKVETLQIASGQERAESKAAIRITAISADVSIVAKMPPLAGKDIFDLYNEASEMIRKIEAKQNEANSVQITDARDPMSYAQTIFIPEKVVEVKKPEVKPKPKPKPAPDMPPIIIDSIFWDPSTPVVVIDGKAFKEKEEYNDVTIEKIDKDSVSVTWKGRGYELKK
jgi:hypothetical protein